MTNNVVFIVIVMPIYLYSPNYASAQTGSSNSSCNGDQDGQCSYVDQTMEIVAVVLVGSFFLMGFISVLFRCYEGAPSAHNPPYAARAARLGATSRSGLDPAVIDSFPVLAYLSVKELKNGKASGELECAVCLSEFEELDSLKLLPKCNHVFHPECIDAWLASHVTCPVCRANLEHKLEPDSCPRCGIVNNINSNSGSSSSSSSNSSNCNNLVTNSVPSGSNLQQQPQASISVVVDSRNQKEEEEERRQILGKLVRSHSTGHSLVLQQFNVDSYALRLAEDDRVSKGDEIEKECMRRSSSYDVVLDLGTTSSRECGDFIGRTPSGGGSGQRLCTSIKLPFSFLGLKFDEEEQWRNRPPV